MEHAGPKAGPGLHERAHDAFDVALEWIAMGLEAAGVAAILLGAVFTLAAAFPLLRAADTRAIAYRAFRHKLSHAILLGLELLVAADIVGTVAVEATLDNLAVLAVIVLIRTFLSISLTVEIENRWPWQPAAGGRAAGRMLDPPPQNQGSGA